MMEEKEEEVVVDDMRSELWSGEERAQGQGQGREGGMVVRWRRM